MKANSHHLESMLSQQTKVQIAMSNTEHGRFGSNQKKSDLAVGETNKGTLASNSTSPSKVNLNTMQSEG